MKFLAVPALSSGYYLNCSARLVAWRIFLFVKRTSCLRFGIAFVKRDESLLFMNTSRNLIASSIPLWSVNRGAFKMPENSRGKRWRSTRLRCLLSAAKVGLNFSIFAALLMVISASTTISAIHSCNRGRFVVNSTWGTITNGPENYREDSYCIWLIEGISFFLLKIKKITSS